MAAAHKSYNIANFLPQSSHSAGTLHSIQSEFERWDTDGSGTISEDEFAEIFNLQDPRYKVFCSPYTEKLFAFFDLDGSGEIDFREFVFGISELPMPTVMNSHAKFLFTIVGLSSYVSKEMMFGLVQDSAGAQGCTFGGVSVDPVLEDIGALEGDKLNKGQVECLVKAHAECFKPLKMVWDVIKGVVGPCKALRREMGSNAHLSTYFSDLERKFKNVKDPARSIDEITKRQVAARVKLKKGMSTVLATVRLNRALGGGAFGDNKALAMTAEEAVVKRRSVYQAQAPAFCADEGTKSAEIRARRVSAESSGMSPPFNKREGMRKSMSSSTLKVRGTRSFPPRGGCPPLARALPPGPCPLPPIPL